MDAVDSVHYDASSLFQFIDSVTGPCAVKSYHSYTGPSREFFKFILELGDCTKKHITRLCRDLDAKLLATNPKDFALRAQELATLRYSWFDFHEYIKPAIDAHTLDSPVALVAALTSRLRALPDFKDVRFTIVHTDDLNYFQLQSNHLRSLASQVSAIVSGAPPFPDDLAIVGLPSSQSKKALLNILLAHEMGHLSYEKRGELSRFMAAVTKALQKQNISSFKKPDITRCINLVLNWLEEVYCDLFALSLVGPAYSYAFIELFALTRREPSKVFSASHPALALRLREQTRFLQSSSDPWWPRISAPGNHYVDLLQRMTTSNDSEFSCRNGSPGSVETIALACFFDSLAEAEKAVRSIFGSLDPEVQTFVDQRDIIQLYLADGVVPSRLIVRNEDPIKPSAISILNAAYEFNLTKLDSLLNKLTKVDLQCIECRAYWSQRVEMWTAKALEDVITDGYTLKISY